LAQANGGARRGVPRRASIVIVGGGFGGLNCAKRLSKLNVYITLIDRRNFHLFQPLLYQVASGSLSSGEIASPIRTEFAKRKNVTVLQGEVTGVDVARRLVHICNGDSIRYDYLVVATGSHHHYFGREDWEPLAPGLKTIEDAMTMRSRILGAFEEAELAADDKDRVTAALTFVIVGGGPTGVELAGTIGELAHSTMRGEFRRINTANARVILVENDDRVLPMYTRKLSDKAGEFLRELGVELMLGWKVTDVTTEDVELTSESGKVRIPCHTVLWAAGNKASPLGKILAEQCGTETDRGGRVIVNDYLNVPGWPEIYVIGDMAHAKDIDGKPLPGVAPVAMQQGKYVAENITRKVKNKPPKPFEYFNKGSLAVVGRNRAVAEVGKLQIAGFIAWLMWAGIHIAYLIEFNNRLVVLIRWAANYFARRRGARLITGDEGPVGASGQHDAEELAAQHDDEGGVQPGHEKPPAAAPAPQHPPASTI
jgi:NADH dehydrogenase